MSISSKKDPSMSVKLVLPFLTTLLAIFLLLFTFSTTSVNAATTDFSNNLSNAKLTDEKTGSSNELDVNDTIKLSYDWKLGTLKKGDAATFKLPAALQVANNVNFDLKASDGTVIGTVALTADGTVTVNFTDPNNYLATHSNVGGQLNFETTINTHVVKPGENVTINLGSNSVVTNITGDGGSTTDAPDPNELIYKWAEGNTTSNTISWVARVNYAGKSLNNVTMHDTLGTGQSFKASSLKILQVTHNQAGNITSSKDVTNQFQVTSSDDGTGFTIAFGNINATYLVQYDSQITAEQAGGQYANTIWLTGSSTTSPITVTTSKTTAGGSLTGDTGTLVLTKIDAQTKQALANATFTLTNATTGKVVGTYTTDANGQITITDLLLGQYTLTETKAPIGYQLAKPTPITVSDNQQTQTITIADQHQTGQATLTKLDADTKTPLAGAIFKVVNTDTGAVVETNLVSNDRGQVAINDLPLGHYEFIEMIAPQGYDLNTQPALFQITSDNVAQPQQVTMVDRKTPAIVTPPINPTKPTAPTKPMKPTVPTLPTTPNTPTIQTMPITPTTPTLTKPVTSVIKPHTSTPAKQTTPQTKTKGLLPQTSADEQATFAAVLALLILALITTLAAKQQRRH
ncbi:SpaA isopeptide-forming pilin-related protein [Furfurilactobacillus curtus]|uniref:LPXTG cell wall anchor domain-containing protein n=1 Tax=Furfurilactobacillus curtus TaxID=1746200 RepID=A0ABQ5JQC1_9LACO